MSVDERQIRPSIITVNLTICHSCEGRNPLSFRAVDSRLRGNDSRELKPIYTSSQSAQANFANVAADSSAAFISNDYSMDVRLAMGKKKPPQQGGFFCLHLLQNTSLI